MIQFYFSIFLLVVLTFFALLLDSPELSSLIQTFYKIINQHFY